MIVIRGKSRKVNRFKQKFGLYQSAASLLEHLRRDCGFSEEGEDLYLELKQLLQGANLPECARGVVAQDWIVFLQQTYGLTLLQNDVLKEVAPELFPGIDTALELKNAIESASNGDWWQSAWHFAGAALTLTPWDKIKDSYKFARAIGRANRWFDLIKRCSGYNDEMARGLSNILKKELSNPHIFRKAPGHLPDLQPAISAAGGADNLLFDVYKKISDDGLASGMTIGEIRTSDFNLHGVPLRVRFIRHTIDGVNKIELSDFWKI